MASLSSSLDHLSLHNISTEVKTTRLFKVAHVYVCVRVGE